MSKVFTVLKKSEDENRVLVAYAHREDAIRCTQALADHYAALLRHFDEEMIDGLVASDLYRVVTREDAIGVHVSTIHATANQPGSSTRWLVQEIELIGAETSSSGEDAGRQALLPEGNER
ncbi:MAG: hypothetical protein ACREFN_10195 [Acetobacteraceae bacterium]